MPKVSLGMTDAVKLKQRCDATTEVINEIRRAKGITQDKLSEYTGLSRAQISHQLNHGISMKLYIAIVRLGELDDLDEEKIRRVMLKK